MILQTKKVPYTAIRIDTLNLHVPEQFVCEMYANGTSKLGKKCWRLYIKELKKTKKRVYFKCYL